MKILLGLKFHFLQKHCCQPGINAKTNLEKIKQAYLVSLKFITVNYVFSLTEVRSTSPNWFTFKTNLPKKSLIALLCGEILTQPPADYFPEIILLKMAVYEFDKREKVPRIISWLQTGLF